MLKIVPDPPHHQSHSLEDLLIQTSEHLACASTVAYQTVLLDSQTPGQLLTMATMHQIDRAQVLVEMALSKVQSRH
ncbi:MAG TPA: hypothetical protein VJS90_03180 [Pseudomonas sp.]|uniref:hypothetical protein n=1 Tax=Pseudomonas sp. TaxID=306 RepID=UPI002B49A7C4|nr:hypothetical protein [Pseudomonas sp.]HKS12021.1 hypothetical protein [Pseudomonas sp.]